MPTNRKPKAKDPQPQQAEDSPSTPLEQQEPTTTPKSDTAKVEVSVDDGRHKLIRMSGKSHLLKSTAPERRARFNKLLNKSRMKVTHG